MACEVKTIGNIQHFGKVQRYFGLRHDDNWLNAINYAISPLGETIALAQGEKIVILNSMWDRKKELYTYNINWCGQLENPNQIITSVICLPMFHKNSNSIPSWTCIAFGLNNGVVVFYNSMGDKLYSQCFHEEVVCNIKAISPSKNIKADPILYVIYDKCVCYISGTDFISHLNNLNYNLHRANKYNIVQNINANVKIDDTLRYDKFYFKPCESDGIVNDACIVPFRTLTLYDNIITQCLYNGYKASIFEIPLQTSTVLSVGSKPFIGFYNADEGYKTHTLGEVAKDVIGNAYRHMLENIFGHSPEVKEKQHQQERQNMDPVKEINMRNKCSFNDGKRGGYTIAIAPGGRLAATVDNLDRVMLIDTQRLIIKRIWKGYREAQCGFIVAKEKSLKGSPSLHRRALFLVIYAPRLGCLEIWPVIQGPKLAAFTVIKSGQLVYNTHRLIGLSNDVKGIKTHSYSCFFLDSNNNNITVMEVPFHYALSSINSDTSRDMDILKRIKNLLRCNSYNNMENIEEFALLAKEFKTIEIRQQCIEMLLKNKYLKPNIFQVIIDAFDFTLKQQIDDVGDKEESNKIIECFQRFHTFVKNYQRLCKFYVAIQKQSEISDEIESIPLSEHDVSIVKQLVTLLHGVKKRKKYTVTFDIDNSKTTSLEDFISIFQIDQIDSIVLLPEYRNNCSETSCHIFSTFFQSNFCIEDFKNLVKYSNISCDDMLTLILKFWLEQPFIYETSDQVIVDMSRLATAVRAICELVDNVVNDYNYQSISQWWQNVRELLLESPKSLSLLVAIVCKTVAKDLRKDFKESSSDEASLNENEEKWEKISHDEAQWILLINKLEDIAILGAILENPIDCLEPVMPEILYEPPDCSLKLIVTGGQGIVTDLTSQWLINSRIHPSKIMLTSKISEKDLKLTNKKQKDEVDKKDINNEYIANDEDPVLVKLTLLQKHFPFSLEPGVLLTLMCWHYMIYWSKHFTNLKYFKAALICLEQFHNYDYSLKHGICCLLWQVTLKFPLQNTFKLMHKVGRLPIEKMCQQDIEMSASNVPEFLECCLEFIGHLNKSINYTKRELQFEDALTEGPMPLQTLAVQQQPAKKDLLKIYYELCSVLHFMAYFQFKFVKPLTNLFDAVTNKSFLMDINKDLPFLLPAPDLALQEVRIQFLSKVITASMDQIREDLEQLFVTEHMQYMEKIIALADSWCLNKGPLYRKQIIDLYAHGFDNNAAALLQNITEDKHIGRMLLEIAGRRMELYIKDTKARFLIVASVGTQLLKYLDDLQKNLTTTSIVITATDPLYIDLSALIKLISQSTNYLTDNDSEYARIACQMFSACNLLREEKN